MALDERGRHELFLRLEQVLGAESAETLMELMPPWLGGCRHQRDLDALEERMNLRFGRWTSGSRWWISGWGVGPPVRGVGAQAAGRLPGGAPEPGEPDQFAVPAHYRPTRTLLIANIGTVLSLAALAFAAAKLT